MRTSIYIGYHQHGMIQSHTMMQQGMMPQQGMPTQIHGLIPMINQQGMQGKSGGSRFSSSPMGPGNQPYNQTNPK
jgi:hypothetical protein